MTTLTGSVAGRPSTLGGVEDNPMGDRDQPIKDATANLGSDKSVADSKTTADKLANSKTSAEQISNDPTTAEILSSKTTPATQRWHTPDGTHTLGPLFLQAEK